MALVTPDRATLKKLASKFTKEDLPFEEMCEDKDVTGAALRELVNHGKKFNLEKFEIPGKIRDSLTHRIEMQQGKSGPKVDL